MTHAQFSSLRRFGALEGLRAIAILLVFTAHPRATWWEALHGPTGVTLFFVLSGFLITTLLLREESRYGKVDFPSFYLRRTFRIYPMFFGVFAFYCVLIFLLNMQPDRRHVFAENVRYVLLFFPEHMNYFYPGAEAPPFNGAWSIGIEEKFYLVWPVLAFAVLATVKRARIPVLVALAAASIGSGMIWHLAYLTPYQHLAYGGLVAVLLHRERTYRVTAALGRPPVLLGLVVAAVVLQLSTSAVLHGWLYSLDGLVLAAVLGGLVTTQTPRVAWLRSRPMAFLAAISYVFYLIHNFALNAVEAVVPERWGVFGSLMSTGLALAVAVAASWIIHRLYEEPMRMFGVRLAGRVGRQRSPGQVPQSLEVAAVDAGTGPETGSTGAQLVDQQSPARPPVSWFPRRASRPGPRSRPRP